MQRLGISIFIFFILFSAHSQTFKKTEDGRFMGHLEASAPLNDKTQLLSTARLTFEWWTLLAEPVELYHIKWQANDHFVYNNRRIDRSHLVKYPDLLKRFDNLRPTKIDFRIDGTAYGNRTSVRRGTAMNNDQYSHVNTYKKDGKSYDEYQLNGSFVYVVRDIKLLVNKAGAHGDGIVPGSPHWNDFWRWGLTSFYDYDKINTKDEAAKKENMNLFKNTTSITLSASIISLEWPEYELKAIIEKFDKYQKGEAAPSPKEEVDSLLSALYDMETYEGDDEWAEPVQDFKLEKVYDQTTGKYGFKNEYGQQIIPPRFSSAEEFIEGKAIVQEDGKYGIINKQGAYLLKLETGYIAQIYQNIVVVSGSGGYGLFSLQGEQITGFKFSSIGKFENGRAEADILKRTETLEYDPCDDRYLNYYERGVIDMTGNWVVGPREHLSITGPLVYPTLTLKRNYETVEEERAAERRAEAYKRRKEECIEKRRADLNRIKNQVRSSGGTVSD